MTKPIPEGYHSVTPHLIVDGGVAALEFYKKAFGAIELFRIPAPGGKIGHAEIKIGDSPIMLADEHPDMGYMGPKSIGGSPVSLMIYVEDVDTVFNRAVAGREVAMPEQRELFFQRPGRFNDALEPPLLHLADLLAVGGLAAHAILPELLQSLLIT